MPLSTKHCHVSADAVYVSCNFFFILFFSEAQGWKIEHQSVHRLPSVPLVLLKIVVIIHKYIGERRDGGGSQKYYSNAKFL